MMEELMTAPLPLNINTKGESDRGQFDSIRDHNGVEIDLEEENLNEADKKQKKKKKEEEDETWVDMMLDSENDVLVDVACCGLEICLRMTYISIRKCLERCLGCCSDLGDCCCDCDNCCNDLNESHCCDVCIACCSTMCDCCCEATDI